MVDVRDEKNVQDAVATTVSEFGGIDILINNASAISLTGWLNLYLINFQVYNKVLFGIH